MGGQIMTKPLGQLSQTEKSDKKESKVIWSKKEKEESKEKYGCEIVIENGSLNEVMTTEAPSDAWIITYEVEGAKNIILDLHNVKFMDSSGLSAMLVGNRTFRETNSTFVICNVSDHIEKILKISKLDTVLDILPTRQEAIDSIQLDEIEKGMN